MNCNYNTAVCGYDSPIGKFTGKERDAETGLDYFGARYYASATGRWMSPDWAQKPEAVPYSKLADPQSLNLYGYVGNNPLRKIDKDGHDPNDGDKDKKLPKPDEQHNHTLTVRYVSGQGGNPVGHITVQIDDNKEVGYGPKQDMSPTDVNAQMQNTKVSTPGQVEPRGQKVITKDAVTINITGDQAKAAQGVIDATASHPGNYQIQTNSCVTFGEKVVAATGAKAPVAGAPSAMVDEIRQTQYRNHSTQP